jgi:hypothetical protein
VKESFPFRCTFAKQNKTTTNYNQASLEGSEVKEEESGIEQKVN